MSVRDETMKKNHAGHAKSNMKTGTGVIRRMPKQDLLVLGFLLLALIVITLIVPAHRWGDASTYYMQVRSIVNDHDIQYTAQDLRDIVQHPFSDVPAGIFLIKTAAGQYFYGKDFSYALFAAPFYALVGNNGFQLFNGLMFFAMIAMGYLYLRRDNGELSVLYAVLFFVLSAFYVYVFWIHADIYNTFLIMLGLFLWLVYCGRNDRRFLIAASLALGLAMVAKAPNAVVFLPLALYEIYKKRYSGLLIAIASFLLPVLLFTGYFFLQTGSLSYYGGDRLYYGGQYPFMSGFNATNEAGSSAFSVDSGDMIGVILNLNNPVIVPYNLFYYFFGRFTGVLWYFPFAIFALVSFLWDLRKPAQVDHMPEKLCILAAIVLYILTFVTALGNNYAGNQLADRYFYIYPAFIFLLGRIDVKKAAIFLLIALFTVVPLIVNPVVTSGSPASHTYQFPYPYFPLEYSQIYQLPMMGTNYQYQGHPIIVYGASPAYSNGIFTIEKSTDMLVYSNFPVNQLKLAILSSNASSVAIDAGGVSQEAGVGAGMKIMTINNMTPAYQDGRYYIYKVDVAIRPGLAQGRTIASTAS